ncbi:MAG: hypothetical protein AAB683_02275 [Patescibacteria group bacterium]
MDNNINQNNMTNGIPPLPQNEKKIGPIVGVLVIILIIVIASLYFFSKRLNTTPTVVEEVVTQQVTNTENTASLSDGTDSNTLNADLDAELRDIDYSF